MKISHRQYDENNLPATNKVFAKKRVQCLTKVQVFLLTLVLKLKIVHFKPLLRKYLNVVVNSSKIAFKLKFIEKLLQNFALNFEKNVNVNQEFLRKTENSQN